MIKIKKEFYESTVKMAGVEREVYLYYLYDNRWEVHYASACWLKEQFKSPASTVLIALQDILNNLKQIDENVDYKFYQDKLEKYEKAFSNSNDISDIPSFISFCHKNIS